MAASLPEYGPALKRATRPTSTNFHELAVTSASPILPVCFDELFVILASRTVIIRIVLADRTGLVGSGINCRSLAYELSWRSEF